MRKDAAVNNTCAALDESHPLRDWGRGSLRGHAANPLKIGAPRASVRYTRVNPSGAVSDHPCRSKRYQHRQPVFQVEFDTQDGHRSQRPSSSRVSLILPGKDTTNGGAAPDENEKAL